MTNALKKISVAITGMLMALTAPVNGVDYNQISCCPPECCDAPGCQFFLSGELLYWRPSLCGLESAFGTTGIAATVANSILTTTITETDVEPHSKWSPGFRIGGEVACDAYDVAALWTHFNGRATFNDGPQHGHWKIHYDAVDLVLGRNISMWSSCFNVRPFIGVRGLRIHQRLRSHLETIFTSALGSSTILSDMNDRESFRAVGPQLGFEADVSLGCNFRLYGSFDVVSYYGKVKGNNCDFDTFATTVSATRAHKHRCFNSIGTDAAIGIIWDKTVCYCCNEWNFRVNLGVEQHRIYDFSDLGSDGTLSLDGGVFGVAVGFKF